MAQMSDKSFIEWFQQELDRQLGNGSVTFQDEAITRLCELSSTIPTQRSWFPNVKVAPSLVTGSYI